MNSAKWLDESIFNFTLCGKFGRWVLFVFEGCTLTIPQLPLGGFKKAKSGVWSRLHINNPPTAVGGIWGDLKRSGCIAGFGSACKEREAEHLRTWGGGVKVWKILANVQTSDPQMNRWV